MVCVTTGLKPQVARAWQTYNFKFLKVFGQKHPKFHLLRVFSISMGTIGTKIGLWVHFWVLIAMNVMVCWIFMFWSCGKPFGSYFHVSHKASFHIIEMATTHKEFLCNLAHILHSCQWIQCVLVQQAIQPFLWARVALLKGTETTKCVSKTERIEQQVLMKQCAMWGPFFSYCPRICTHVTNGEPNQCPRTNLMSGRIQLHEFIENW